MNAVSQRVCTCSYLHSTCETDFTGNGFLALFNLGRSIKCKEKNRFAQMDRTKTVEVA